ncbi:hypothetical protein SmJEL517_g05095 [Synchytrium microbalum]|uniref:Uncharacterized protein n=1 Tax=Synchytrium microbalum TaxID=1806994 RepID=A0A507BN86_9FUNG|nr:uncharacterized protein SmJEL517_g05095 [Synchytrium microbalum]TPX31590.1 hypothetical protein SmJEL517_g05095 [Synchytrium microbalum]
MAKLVCLLALTCLLSQSTNARVTNTVKSETVGPQHTIAAKASVASTVPYAPKSRTVSKSTLPTAPKSTDRILEVTTSAFHLPSFDEIYTSNGCVPPDSYNGYRRIYLNLTREWAYPAGVSKQVIAVNGEFPAPPVVGVEGEILQVTVFNNLEEPTSIHWHGLHGFYQRHGLTVYDGSSFAAQCPIPVGASFTQFIALFQTGTYWYHSHSGLQYGDGLRAAVVVLPRCQRPLLRGVESFVITVTEHYFNTSTESQAAFLSPSDTVGIISPDTGLINGVGQFDCKNALPINHTCRAVTKPYTVKVLPNKVYMLRFAAISSIGAFNVSIAGHKMTVIEADGDDMVPVEVPEFEMSIGQRITALIRTDARPARNYQILARMSLSNVQSPYSYFNNNFTAVLHYQGAPVPTWTNMIKSTEIRLNTLHDYDPIPVYGYKETTDYSVKCPTQHAHFGPCYLDKRIIPGSHPSKKVYCPKEVDKRIQIYWGFFQTNQTGTFYPFMTYSVNGVHVETNSSWVATPIPILGLVKGDLPLPSKSNPIFLELGDVVEIVISNAGRQSHTWHLHGQSFYITARGTSNTDNITAEMVQNATRLEGAAYRDSIFMPVDSWFALRFKADNEGVWPMHCHIDFHLLTGMAVNFIVGKKKIQEELYIPSEWYDTCNAARAEVVRAQDDDESDDTAAGTAKIRVEDVQFTHYFPNNPFKTIVPGQPTECLIGMKNLGIKNETYTVYGLTGALVSPQNLSTIIKNLTAVRYIVTLEPYEEATLPYKIKVDLDSMDVGLVVLVDYIDSEENPLRGLGFSDTVKITSPISTFDIQTLSVYVLLVAFVGIVGYFTYTTFLVQYLPQSPPKRKTRSSTTAGPSSSSSVVAAGGSSPGKSDENGSSAPTDPGKVNMDWIPDHLKNEKSPKMKKRK